MKTHRRNSYGFAVAVMLLFCATVPCLAQRARGRRREALCHSQFEVSNRYSAPVDVWAYGDDGDWSYLGTAYPGQAGRFTHAYGPERESPSRCEKCAHTTQIQYRVPAGYADAGALLCVDSININPCEVKRTTFSGPQLCGSPGGGR